MYKNLTIITVLGVLAVILGAFGAHALKSQLSPTALQSFETAVRYQFIHVIVLLIINMFGEFSSRQKQLLTYIFVIGIVLFSGSIYAIHLLKISPKLIWFITPLGGLTFIVGWVIMIVFFMRKIRQR